MSCIIIDCKFTPRYTGTILKGILALIQHRQAPVMPINIKESAAYSSFLSAEQQELALKYDLCFYTYDFLI